MLVIPNIFWENLNIPVINSNQWHCYDLTISRDATTVMKFFIFYIFIFKTTKKTTKKNNKVSSKVTKEEKRKEKKKSQRAWRPGPNKHKGGSQKGPAEQLAVRSVRSPSYP